MLLRDSGYNVEELYSVEGALRLVESSKVDLLLVCHTLTFHEHEVLIRQIHDHCKALPVICLVARESDGFPGCLNVLNSPDELLQAIRSFDVTASSTRP